ncbi:hypothetical protein CALCODRAFT_497002 [Calocera cornea HHB12733]|uniref:Uncharacterized protein n=1 Tax=Calocera cornea HHB12733 TaxID=1353952 RepID=A0A165FJ43_9BASI|nr:hypothetical protein CALCODRAFT_497002 [Calocera cornea HHB12733]
MLLFLFTMIKTVPILRRRAGPLPELLLRDGTVYFAIVFVTAIVSSVMLVTLGPEGDAAAEWFSILTPMAAGRLFLNLKGMGNMSQTPSPEVNTDDSEATTEDGVIGGAPAPSATGDDGTNTACDVAV